MQAVTYNTYCLKKHQLMMEEELPNRFDVIVVGTGLEESILAAAASRNGHSVLHLDTNNFYGGDWAAFNFEGLQEWRETLAKDKGTLSEEEVKQLEQDFVKSKEEKLIIFKGKGSAISSVQEDWFVPENIELGSSVEGKAKESQPTDEAESVATSEADAAKSDSVGEGGDGGDEAKAAQKAEETSKSCDASTQSEPNAPIPASAHGHAHRTEWTREKVRLASRHFNLDLTPKLFFSRGPMIELLISSNISRYTEFKSVSRVLTLLNGALEHVPSSRSDVFSTKHVSVVEKRILMKFLTYCLNYDTVQPEKLAQFRDASFREFLRHEKLTDNLIHFVLHSIAMVDDSTRCEDGLRATQKFLGSLGRFGNTPFLWSMYGAGELPQAFCRLCAVFGGTYFLGRAVQGFVVTSSSEKRRCLGVVTDRKRIDCGQLVIAGQLCPAELKPAVENKSTVKRDVYLLNDSVLPSEKEQLTFVSLPPRRQGESYTYVQEVGFSAAACPKGMYCLQATRKMGDDEADENAEDERQRTLLPDDKKTKVWRLSFKMEGEVYRETEDEDDGRPVENAYVCSGPRFELDFDDSVANSRRIFGKMFPGEEFLPRAPEPEEIIIGGGEEGETGQGEESEANKEAAEEQDVGQKKDTKKASADEAIDQAESVVEGDAKVTQ